VTAMERIADALGRIEHEVVAPADGTPCLRVARAEVRPLMEALKSDGGFEVNVFVTAIDHEPATPRFEVVWEFLSVKHSDRVRVRTSSNDEFPNVPTIIDLWPGAAFFERECYDMFGVQFEGHANLRRLLMPMAFDHHPLRKEFPHQGIEPDKLYRAWDKARRTQEGQPS